MNHYQIQIDREKYLRLKTKKNKNVKFDLMLQGHFNIFPESILIESLELNDFFTCQTFSWFRLVIYPSGNIFKVDNANRHHRQDEHDKAVIVEDLGYPMGWDSFFHFYKKDLFPKDGEAAWAGCVIRVS